MAGQIIVSPLPNHKARTPAATVTAQMRSGLVVTFLFYPVEDLAQNVHRCVLSYNRDEVIARRRAAGLPVNLDNNSTNSERRDSTGQSTAPPTSISVEDNGETKLAKADDLKSKESKPEPSPKTVTDTGEKPATTLTANPLALAVEKKDTAQDERVKSLTLDALLRATKKPKQFKNWTKPAHGLSLSVIRHLDPKNECEVVVVAVKNLNADSIKLVQGSPDVLIEMVDEQSKPINLESIKKLHTEVSAGSDAIPAGKTAYYAIAYAAPVLGAHQQVKVVVSHTNAADEPASIALSSNTR